MDPIQALLIISFPLLNVFSHAVAPLYHPLLAIRLSGVLKRAQKDRLFIQDQFNLFRGCYLIQAI